jgi:CheY-like chemotaxis protein
MDSYRTPPPDMHRTLLEKAKELFARELRRILYNLYDPEVLFNSPFTELFDVQRREDAIGELQNILVQAIHSLKPGGDVPQHSNAWRVYRILHDRFIDQFSQEEVASTLSLSSRQVRRHEHAAQVILAETLWNHARLDARPDVLQALEKTSNRLSEETTPSREEELAWLEKTGPQETIDMQGALDKVRHTVRPVLEQSRSSLLVEVDPGAPPIQTQEPVFRQLLVHLVLLMAERYPGGSISLRVQALLNRVGTGISVTARYGSGTSSNAAASDAEKCEMAEQLAKVTGGVLEIDDTFARILYPSAWRLTVLVIDDNEDTLHLLERYLADTRYQFLPTRDPTRALEIALEEEPTLILTDVMLPKMDGWELVGRFREHPQTHNIPLIVCTILAQEQLALALGATAFLRKPVNRQSLLLVFDQQVDRLMKIPVPTPGSNPAGVA